LAGGLADYIQSKNLIADQPVQHTPSFQKIIDLEKKLAISDANLKNEKMAPTS